MNAVEVQPVVDSHAHLDAIEFAGDRDDVIRRAGEVGLVGIVTVGTDLASSRMAVALAERYPILVAAVGIHPHHALQCDAGALRELRTLARHDRVVGIGETGLDYFRNRAPGDVQRDAFRAQLRLAKDLGLPVIVHDREAHEDVLRIIEEEIGQDGAGHGASGILHCFSGDVAMARRAVDDLGLYVSVAGPVTYPRNECLADVVRAVEIERLLLETDCPYLAPQPLRGRRNEPAYIRTTAVQVAALRSQPVADIARQTTANATRLFGRRLPAMLPGRAVASG